MIDWENRIGKEKAEEIKNYSASRGSQLHDLVERYLKNVKINWMKENPYIVMLFNQAKPFLDRIDEVWGIEASLYSDELKVAGRLDALVKIKNTLCILDMKTSLKEKKESWIKNYFMQASTYSYCLKELFNIEAKRICIVITNENSNSPSIFIKDPSNYIDDFRELRNQYV